jgi:general secretion pathway protein G
LETIEEEMLETLIHRRRQLPPTRPSRARRAGAAGFTLAELVMVAAVMVALSAAVFPVVKFTSKRSKEMDLRLALREMRLAIDTYKRYSDQGMLPAELTTEGYPKDLEVLVKGQPLVGQVDKKLKLLRRIPVDPMTGKAEWGVRSYKDEPDATSTGGENVYDVYSLSGGVGLNGIPYRKW